ncbi:hypothetical protein NBRC111894_1045 [Sporolactobacillus inulinus]|uniref:Uncharacterized protein n=1 Tax=Sporolactobacillus inulinus TaxID=2078 RepID=A0A4Y1Z9B4_9BACL|nr:hypothetical protein NBRC111894_1045 [Sporolactobacillus inulinus]
MHPLRQSFGKMDQKIKKDVKIKRAQHHVNREATHEEDTTSIIHNRSSCPRRMRKSGGQGL